MRPAAPLLIGLAVVCAGQPGGAAPVPKHLMKQEPTEQEKLQGRWKLEFLRIVGDGLAIDVPSVERVFEIRGEDLTITVKQGRVTQKSTAKLKFDAAGGMKRLTIANTRRVDEDGEPEAQGPDTSYGYVLDGDKLTMAVRTGGTEPRTAADPAKPDGEVGVLVLTRVKDKN